MRYDLRGRTILITGGARGIGAALARGAAARGARVALAGLEPALLREVAREVDGHWYECDVTDQNGLDQAVASTVERYGGIDVVVANAGVANLGTVATGPVEALVRTIEVNLSGVVRTVSAALPHVLAAQGHVLIVSSAAAFAAMPGMAAYCASKAGVEQFGNVLRLENRRHGLTVGTAHPIWIDTDLVRDIRDDFPSFRDAQSRLPWPLSRVVSVERCADALLHGIERRRRKIYIPRSIALVQALRPVVLSGFSDALITRFGGGDLAEQMAVEVRRSGRAFGRSSVGDGRP
ncbi:SDR family oxidoreductase [Micromonospora endophytica]|uniref:Short-chain dehydrogenase n=1 Tax=Micromonospora endophytica TaxID=515350 RepID=A0A2W2CGK5_9ACTN|nr:SDR family oxidoreductase [Micromonospora endophytica]PZF98551.1 short-chain dehydrogenase [Micromonospora endophytica]RIW43523.1 SDR family oxidoreductase [Micromonospora endophytica]BCJ62841.1 oxidoreductase [Micromonospora endophytica]